MDYQVILKNVTKPRITITKDRATLKLPISISDVDRIKYENYISNIIDTICPVKKSFGGHFMLPDSISLSDKYGK